MFYVYILHSTKGNNLYIGCTSDIDKRLQKHKSGCVKATKHRQPLVHIHIEEFESKADAFKRERFLKSLWGAREKKKIRDDYFRKMG